MYRYRPPPDRTMKRSPHLNTYLLTLLLGVASWQLWKVEELDVSASLAIERLAQHDQQLVEAKQRIAATEVDVLRLRLQLASMGQRGP